MAPKAKTFEQLIDAVLLSPEIQTAASFIAVLPGSTKKILCLGTREELIDGLLGEFWKTPAPAAHAQAG
jgi:hypothetical protein